jgi:hypothetical protein
MNVIGGSRMAHFLNDLNFRRLSMMRNVFGVDVKLYVNIKRLLLAAGRDPFIFAFRHINNFY